MKRKFSKVGQFTSKNGTHSKYAIIPQDLCELMDIEKGDEMVFGYDEKKNTGIFKKRESIDETNMNLVYDSDYDVEDFIVNNFALTRKLTTSVNKTNGTIFTKLALPLDFVQELGLENAEVKIYIRNRKLIIEKA